ncbi:hypothetical protein VCRA217O315_170121 [Vibrio crassostreae]|nr:hypothetical protein VCRA217O315_170121 [Vibrio crassostreae]
MEFKQLYGKHAKADNSWREEPNEVYVNHPFFIICSWVFVRRH